MKVTKTSIHRISVDMTGCGCYAMQEFEDADFKKPVGGEKAKAQFNACKKHLKQPGSELIEMILVELVEKEALDHKAVAPVNQVRQNASAVVDAEGNLQMRVPINRTGTTPTVGKIKVLASGSHATPNGGRPSAQAARTGPAKTFVRPTASTPRVPQPPADGLATALAQDDEVEDDLLAQNDPERAY
jgi:hypothetical protein